MAREKVKLTVNLDDATTKRQLMAKVGTLRGWHTVTIEPKRPTRSLEQNKFHWALVRLFVETYRDMGVYYTDKTVSVLFKVRCGGLIDREYDPATGELLDESLRSTADYEVGEMVEYLDRVIAWLATDHNIIVEDRSYGVSRPQPQEASSW